MSISPLACPVLAISAALGSVTANALASAQLTNVLVTRDRSVVTQDGYYVGRDGYTPDGKFVVAWGSGGWRHELATGQTVPVSLDPVTGAALITEQCVISNDGQRVAYTTWTDNFHPGDFNGGQDVVLLDIPGGSLSMISVSASGLAGGGDAPAISGDGSTVVFEGAWDGLTPNDQNFSPDVYAYDVATGSLELVSVDLAGQAAQHVGCWPFCAFYQLHPRTFATNYDGRLVAFASIGDLVTTHAGPAYANIYIRDRQLGVSELVSVSLQGTRANGPCGRPAMSSDGRFVAFECWANDLTSDPAAPLDANTGFPAAQVFVRDRALGSTKLVSRGPTGAPSEAACSFPALSSDGSTLAFASYSATLDPNDPWFDWKIFRADRVQGSIRVVSRSTTGASSADFPHGLSALSGSGDRLVFSTRGVAAGASLALSPLPIVHLRDERVQSVPITAYCTAKTNTLGCTPSMSTAGICSFTYPTAFFVTSARQRSHQIGQLIWSTAQQTTPFQGGFLCVGWPLQRTPVQASLGASSANDCTGGYSFLFSAQYAAANGLGPGSTVYAQYWSRDPSASNPGNRNLSNAIAFTWAP